MDQPCDKPRRTRWLTKRMFFSVLGIIIATTMVYTGKMDAHTWVESLLVIIAGHHAEDLIAAWRK